MGIAARLLANGTFISSSQFDEVTQSTVSVRPGAVYAGGLDEVTGVMDGGTGTTSVSTGSVSFNGTNQYLLTPATSALEFGSNNFTIEMWWYPTSTSRQALYHGSFGSDWSIGIDYNSTGTTQLGIWASSNGTSWNLINSDAGGNGIGSYAPTQNTWNHIAFVRNGNVWTLYVNGVVSVSVTVAGSVVGRASSQKAIGNWWNTNQYDLSGYISNFRVVNGTAVYTSAFTPSTAPLTAISGTSLLTAQSSSTITDASTNAFTITNNNGSVATTSNPFIGGSALFNGSSSKLTVTTNSNYALGTGDFTLECWAYRTGAGTGDRFLISSGNGNSYLLRWMSSGVFEILVSDGGVRRAQYTWAFPTNQWHHIAGTRQSGNLYLFINGALVAGPIASTGSIAADSIGIGGNDKGNSDYFSGYISNARVVKGTAVYTSAFTPPTAPLIAVIGTVLLTTQSASTITDASTYAATITNSGVNASGISPINTIAGTGTASTLSSSVMRQVNGKMFIAGRFIEGQDSVLNPVTAAAGYTVNYLVVGGGGGGGSGNGGGGGGGGGMVSGTTNLSGGTTYSITVGAGGITNGDGSDSKLTGGSVNITGLKGGAGGFDGYPSGTWTKGQGGFGTYGSGGGAARDTNLSPNPALYSIGGAGTPGQGNPGGSSIPGMHGGGGGGAGGASPDSYGQGGNGLLWPYTGSYYGGGGGGATFGVLNTPSLGGGGKGGNYPAGPGASSGIAGTGGGGGGTGPIFGNEPGSGGSGVVILAVPSTSTGTATGASGLSTPALAPGMKVLTWTSPGTYVA